MYKNTDTSPFGDIKTRKKIWKTVDPSPDMLRQNAEYHSIERTGKMQYTLIYYEINSLYSANKENI